MYRKDQDMRILPVNSLSFNANNKRGKIESRRYIENGEDIFEKRKNGVLVERIRRENAAEPSWFDHKIFYDNGKIKTHYHEAEVDGKYIQELQMYNIKGECIHDSQKLEAEDLQPGYDLSDSN